MKKLVPQLAPLLPSPPALVAPRPSGEGLPQVWRAAAPDRDARVFLRMLNLATRVRPIEHYSLSEIRKVWRLTAQALGRRLPVASVTQLEIDGPSGPLALRVFKPHRTDQLLPAFLWCYGGGFVVGDLDTAESICRNIAVAAGCITIAVRYRLAPEHDLTAGREDFLAALEWIAAHGEELGIDTRRLAIGGDSAGGNICAAVAQESVRRGGPELSLQVLAYPATELVLAFPSLAENADGYLITDSLLGQIQLVAASAIETLDPTAPWLSPRRNPDLAKLPPALVVSAGFDPIRDDGLDYTCRLRAAKVPVELLHYAGQFHGFLNFDAVVGAGQDALQRIGAALAHVFAGEPASDRTLEIADETAPGGAVGEATRTALTVWSATDGWRDALLRRVSPTLAGFTQWMLTPCLAPANLMRRQLDEQLQRRITTQTYPVRP
ncbi:MULTISPECIES: alpha/beta hydrolase [unclassified Pseudomonas]|uniref:alpha/beta hydrolase n=1 Tax=unclassified Pseudomonas TaxID=196821 RepID=UPI000A42713F|nr:MULTISPECIES: alpha/beta hydrolase [unclassified Pseudomonas]